MLRAFGICCLLGFSLGHAGEWADSTLLRMSLEEKVGQLFVIPVCELRDDEHFDDGITDSEQTDNEMQNNLLSFKHKDMTGGANVLLDSDADSDAGNSSYRFSLSNI